MVTNVSYLTQQSLPLETEAGRVLHPLSALSLCTAMLSGPVLLLLLPAVAAWTFSIRSIGYPLANGRRIGGLVHPRQSLQRIAHCLGQTKLFAAQTDEDFEQLLDDMIYSGDIEGFLRRNSRDLINEDFLDFLEEKVETLTEEDEKEVVQSIMAMIDEKIRLTDGLSDSVAVYETR
jgi:hypothetical protein